MWERRGVIDCLIKYGLNTLDREGDADQFTTDAILILKWQDVFLCKEKCNIYKRS